MNDVLKTNLIADVAIFSEKSNCKLNVITASGIFTGTLLPENPDKAKYAHVLEFLEYRKKNKDDNERFMLLVDATLSTSKESTLNLPFVVLFIDQIIGVSSVQ
ncbi:TPA: hypothetical protein ACG4JI_001014 [Streptococcus agalactiae]